MYYFYRKNNREHGICPLYRGCPPFGESVIRGFTVMSIQPDLLPGMHWIYCRVHLGFCMRENKIIIFNRLGTKRKGGGETTMGVLTLAYGCHPDLVGLH